MRAKPRAAAGRGGKPRKSEIEEEGKEDEETGQLIGSGGGSGKGAMKQAGGPPLRWSLNVPPAWLSLVSALAYGFTSLAMVFINKGVLMDYPHSMTLLTLQMAVAAFSLQTGGKAGWINMKPFNMQTASSLIPLAFFYNANVAFSLASLKDVNIPMYIALKRLTPMAVLITGFFYGKAKPPLQVSLSVTTTVVGCIIAALGDFSFDMWGYGLALTSVACQTAYLVLVERSGAEDGLSSFELMLYNAVLSLPVLAVIILATGEAAVAFPLLYAKCVGSVVFTAVVVVSLFMGIVLNYTMFVCTIVNSALTTTIVGVLKGVGSTTLGFFVLGGVEVRALNVSGLVINTLGGVWYSIAKYQQKSSGKKVLPTPAAEPLLPTSTNPSPLHSA